MVKAPEAWWERLDFLAPDAQAEFGRLVALLERGLSSTGIAPRIEDPAGWSGLARRGPWDRMLPAEWALADISPEEFARRADEGELAFWEMARESLEQSRSVWVWVDVGPDQIGACRVVQIALLLWLQRLCLRSGGEFYWGTIQTPEKGYEQFGAEELTSYLAARSVDPPRCPPQSFAGVQTWCVGSEAWMSQVPANFRRIVLRQISLEAVELRDGARLLSLPLHAGQRAVRLLRNPTAWGLHANAAPVGVPAGPMVFSPCGRKLMVASDDRITMYPVPSSANEQPGKPRVFALPWTGRVIALSMAGRAIHLVQLREHEWVFSRLNPSQAHEKHWETVMAPDQLEAPLGHCWLWQDEWHLWVGNRILRASHGQLEAVKYTRGGYDNGRNSIFATIDGRIVNLEGQNLHPLPLPAPQWVYMARGTAMQVGRLGYSLACRYSEREWSLLWKEETAHFVLEGRVAGLVGDYDKIALLVEEQGRLRLQGVGWSEPLSINETVEECLVHPSGVMAYRTVGGGLGCYGFPERATRWVARS